MLRWLKYGTYPNLCINPNLYPNTFPTTISRLLVSQNYNYFYDGSSKRFDSWDTYQLTVVDSKLMTANFKGELFHVRLNPDSLGVWSHAHIGDIVNTQSTHDSEHNVVCKMSQTSELILRKRNFELSFITNSGGQEKMVFKVFEIKSTDIQYGLMSTTASNGQPQTWRWGKISDYDHHYHTTTLTIDNVDVAYYTRKSPFTFRFSGTIGVNPEYEHLFPQILASLICSFRVLNLTSKTPDELHFDLTNG